MKCRQLAGLKIGFGGRHEAFALTPIAIKSSLRFTLKWNMLPYQRMGRYHTAYDTINKQIKACEQSLSRFEKGQGRAENFPHLVANLEGSGKRLRDLRTAIDTRGTAAEKRHAKWGALGRIIGISPLDVKIKRSREKVNELLDRANTVAERYGYSNVSAPSNRGAETESGPSNTPRRVQFEGTGLKPSRERLSRLGAQPHSPENSSTQRI
jgi:hypothetical protein